MTKVRTVLANRLRTIEGLRVSERWTGSITPPAAVVIPGVPSSGGVPAVRYDQAFRNGLVEMNFTVKVMVSTGHDDAAQAALDAYLADEDERSVKAAIDAGMTDLVLDGEVVASSARVSQVDHYGLVGWGGLDYLGADLRVEVKAV
ncbi:hypothetical protein AB0I72_19195 [Nocardiopsis sp. NPDC049922]|uniref:hypothetical protein n=1 Tax=Nocardiopsis sp. NPDC049922 TaxID=3155157 RepID=UPI0033FFE8E1